MTKQIISTLLLLLSITPCLMAQKKELSQARSYIKSGNYDGADQLMMNLLKDTANRANEKVYLTLYDAVRGKYNQGNEKFYLKQSLDTAAFFGNVNRMFTVLETLDSIDARPNKKGRVAPSYRKRHASQMDAQRSNLFNGGVFHVRKGNWKDAYKFFQTYIDCRKQPLFTGYDYNARDKRMPEAAYWATFSAYKQHDPELTLRYQNTALLDSSRAAFTLQYVAEAYLWQNDRDLYLTTLQEGFRRFPQFAYFFPRLIDEYTRLGQHEKALAAADSAIAVNDSSQLFLFAKSSALLRLERNEACIEVCQRLIQLNDSLSEVYFNAGTAHMNIAMMASEDNDKKTASQHYQSARTYMETYRKMSPDEKSKWAPALYRIYLNLNMGRQFDEIDELLKK